MALRKLAARIARRILRSVEEKPGTESVPFDGFTDNRISIPQIERLSNEDLTELNTILKWNAFVADSNGRRFGDKAWSGKRDIPQQVPDYRHAILNKHIPLQNRSVLEIGCFEGIHTVSLCRLAGKVIAVDSRIENVVKTIVRCGIFGAQPSVFKCDVEDGMLRRNG